MDVEHQQINMKDQATGKSFESNNERILNTMNEVVENIVGEETQDKHKNTLENYNSKELERSNSGKKVNKQIPLDNQENAAVLVENGIDDTNILSETIIPVVIAPEEHESKKEPLVPANSERQASLASAVPPKQAPQVHKGTFSGIISDFGI